MSKWYDNILEVNDIIGISINSDTISLTIKNNKIDFFKKSFADCIVFRYLYLNFNDKPPLSYKNCFIIDISIYDKEFSILFNNGELLNKEEHLSLMRGIKLNKIINKNH
jgi:hypothetical protein